MSAAVEKHYTPAEIAKIWAVSEKTVIRAFRDAEGVLRLGSEQRTLLRIPESVLAAHHDQRSRGFVGELKRRRRRI
jgi:AraC-like DNA-binding protein